MNFSASKFKQQAAQEQLSEEQQLTTQQLVDITINLNNTREFDPYSKWLFEQITQKLLQQEQQIVRLTQSTHQPSQLINAALIERIEMLESMVIRLTEQQEKHEIMFIKQRKDY